MRMRRRTAGIGGAIVIAAVVALMGNTGASAEAGPEHPLAETPAGPLTAPSTDAAPSTPFAPVVSTPEPVTTPLAAADGRPVVAAIGDSIMDGHGVGADQAWPVLVAEADYWQLTNLSVDGTGFVQLGNDGNTFEAQVVEAADVDATVVIISASSNDLGQDPDTIAAATLATMISLRGELPRAQIIALSAFWGDTAAPRQLSDIDDDLQTAATATGATYIDIGQPLAGEPQLMQSDDVHPTAQGLARLAAAIGADIAQQRVIASSE